MKRILLTCTAIAALLAPPAEAAISVGPTGVGPLTFDAAPATTDWSTGVLVGDGNTYGDATQLDAGVQTLNAANIVRTMVNSSTIPPSTYSGGFRYNTAGFWIQSRPTTDGTNAANVLLATLQNDTGATATRMSISYDFSTNSWLTGGNTPGLYAYYSLSGEPGSWIAIPELSGSEVAGLASAEVQLSGTWAAGSLLYLLWADDNSSAITDPSYMIDNFSLVAGQGVVEPAIDILTPADNITVPLSYTLNVTTRVQGAINSVDFIVDGGSVANDATPPFNLALDTTMFSVGSHILSARANVEGGATVQTTNQTFTLLDNQSPVIEITNVYSGTVTGNTFLVGSPVTFQTRVSDDVSVTNIEWYVDSTLYVNKASNDVNLTYIDTLVGNHTIYAVAVDNSGLRTTTPEVPITITNPPVNVTVLIANGSQWFYYDTNLSLGVNFPPPADSSFGTLQWTDYFYPAESLGWNPLFAEIGGGDGADYPEKSVVDIGPANGRYYAHYFRKSFNIADPSVIQNLQFHLLRDDGAIVYINGISVWTNNMGTTDLDLINPAVIGYTNRANDSDDGLTFQVFNIVGQSAIGSILQPGDNWVAVEVHQVNNTSSDVSFDLMLWVEQASLPTVVITSPTDGQNFIENSSATVTVNASLFITNVAIKLDGVVVAQSDTPPFTVTIPSVGAVGTHEIVAEATDVLGSAPALSQPVIINVGYVGSLWVATNTVWQYLPNCDLPAQNLGTNINGVVVTPQGTTADAWTMPGYDATAWLSGPAILGLGETYLNTTICPSPALVTYYFRRTFTISDPSAVAGLQAYFMRDDAAVIYLNGHEVIRDTNLPAGNLDNLTEAFVAVEPNDGQYFVTSSIPTTYLVAGLNVIAAEVHQDGATSSDIKWQLGLIGTPPVPPEVVITSPINGQVVASSCAGNASVTVTASTVGNVTNVAFSIDGGATINDGTPPFSVTFTGVGDGAHALTAVALDGAGVTANAEPVNITVTAAVPPSLAFGNIYSGSITGLVFPVGVCLTNEVTLTGVIGDMSFVVNGKTNQTLTASQNRTRVQLNDVLAGITVLELVGLDGCGAVVRSAPVTVTITDPPAPVSVIVSNGSAWRYYATSNAPPNDGNGAPWTASNFDDAAWPSGQAELGAGDGLDAPPNAVPETTVIDIGPSGDRYHAIYFRHEFNVANPSVFTNLIVNFLRDDGGVVYLNGAEIFRSNMSNAPVVIDYSSFALGTQDDGNVYHSGATNNTLVTGRNVLAVEVHQNNVTSSDISFDLMLWGESATASAPPIHVVNTGTQIQISWTGSAVLQQADVLTVPPAPSGFSDVPGNPTSPYIINLPASGVKFFRLRTP